MATIAVSDLTHAGIAPEAAERRILVMLKWRPSHDKPNASLGGGVDTPERTERQRAAAQFASEYGLAVDSDWVMASLKLDCYLMTVPGNKPPSATIELLAGDGRVAWAQPLHAFHTLGHSDPLFTLQPVATEWHLAELHAITTGHNVSIAEIDSGVELTHVDLQGQISLSQNFVQESPYAPEAHGTAMAGIMVARADNGVGIVGVAPAARLMALRACWQVDPAAASCDSFSLGKALQFAVNQRADIINLSLAGPEDELLQRLLDAALHQGVIVVAAADPQVQGGGFPASHPGVIAVMQEDTADRFPGVVAPGSGVPTTLLGDRWGLASGSSIAAAHVSGMAALMRELVPAMGPEQTRATLRVTGAPKSATVGRAGRIDACAVIGRLSGVCTCDCPASPKKSSRP
jgi:subtilisin family serine protease